MITPMTKYTFLVYHREYHSFLEELRKQGVVHLIARGSVNERDDEALKEKIGRLSSLRQAIRALPAQAEAGAREEDTARQEPGRLLLHIQVLQKEMEENGHRINALKKEITRTEPWGNFTAPDLSRLKEAGYMLSLFSAPERRIPDAWREKYEMYDICREKGVLYFAVLHKVDEPVEIDAEPGNPSGRPLDMLKAELGDIRQRNDSILEEMKVHASAWKEILEQGVVQLKNEIGMSRAITSAGEEADGKLLVLEGWVPEESSRNLLPFLEGSGCYYFTSEPRPGDEVPVKLRNRNFFRLYEPIAKLFDLPNYKELDLTPFFAPFFMMFFGFCLGDAGYGLIFILAGFLVKRKISAAWRPVVSLAQYLGVGTLVFGIISGTFFGINLIDTGYMITAETISNWKLDRLPLPLIDQLQSLAGEHFPTRQAYLAAVRDLAGDSALAEYRSSLLKHTAADIPLLSSFRHMMQDALSMFYLAVLIGGVQIIFGMLVKVINTTRQKGFAYSLSTVGWIVLALTLIVFQVGEKTGAFSISGMKLLFYALLGTAGAMIFLFNNPDINIFLRVGSGVWETYNVVTGVFGDLLSYIRLFALGISSAILGFVFNDISSQFLNIPYIGWLFFLVMLVIGHSINIFMATLGAFIHPMRLTFVEFYKNAGFRGGGKSYQPFSLQK